MRITNITVNNFKSLVEFKIELSNFSCLIGLNGAGKSTLLQFIDFLGQQVRGDVKGWLQERRWDAKDIKSRLTTKQTIDFQVTLTADTGEISWEGTFNTTLLNCTSEHIKGPNAELEVEKGRLRISNGISSDRNTLLNEKISFSYEGSVLSQLKDVSLPPSILKFKQYFSTIHSLDMLSPEHLRQRTREAQGQLGLGGQNLASFLHELKGEQLNELRKNLKSIYPHLEELNVQSLRSGWKQLMIKERYVRDSKTNGYLPTVETEARHVNDGMLRLVAILSALQSGENFLLFDEIENGINPELIEFVLDKLVEAPGQIMVTTHSPMILNYLSDEVARKGVVYLYRTKAGHTRSIPFFSIPSLAEKLTIMGPGEAFVDTNLTALDQEIAGVMEKK